MKPDRSASRAVVIGSAAYDDADIKSYPTIGRSAGEIAGLLRGSSLWGPQSCRLVTDPATPHDICTAIADAGREVCGGGTLLVYYIGHGEYWLDAAPPDLYLAMKTSLSRQEWSFLGSRYVYKAMRDSRAVRKVLILDCCNSGLASGVLGDWARPQWMEEIEWHGTCVLTATMRESGSQGAHAEDLAEQYTAFSGCLIQILRDGVGDGPAELTVLDLFDALEKRLPRRNHPRPEIISRHHGERIPVFANKTPSRHPRPPQYTRLKSLAPDELARAWTGHEPIPGLTVSAIEDYLPEFVTLRPWDQVTQLVHHVHGLGGERVKMWEKEVLGNAPERTGCIIGTARLLPCADCAAIAQRVEDAAIGSLSPRGLIDYRRGLRCGVRP
jgi:hypothetical protein